MPKFYFVTFLVLLLGNSIILHAKELALQQAIELGLKNNPEILRYLSQFHAVSAQNRTTRGFYDWTLSGLAQYSDTDQARTVIFQPSNIKTNYYDLSLKKEFFTSTTFLLNSSTLKTKDDSTFNLLNSRYESAIGVSLKQELLKGFIRQPLPTRLETDKLRLEAIKKQLWREMEILSFEITQNYLDLWRNTKLFAVAVELEKESKKFFDETKRLSNMGLREQDEILQAEASWLSRKQEILTAQMGMENQWIRLKTIMGVLASMEWGEVPKMELPNLKSNPKVTDTLRSAYQNRGDFLSVVTTLEINQKIKQSFKGNVLPQITASGGYSLLGLDADFNDSLDQIKKSDIKGWNVGMALKHSFGQNGGRSELEMAEAEEWAAQSLYEKIQQQINQEILVETKKVHFEKQVFDLQKQIESNKRKILKAFKNKFGQGRINIQDVLRAEEEFSNALSRSQISESELTGSHLRLFLAEGIFLQSFGYDPEDPLILLWGASSQ